MIAPFGLRHIWLMRELKGASVALDRKSILLEQPADPFRVALRAYLLRPTVDIFTFVLRPPAGPPPLCGFVQAKAQPCAPPWVPQQADSTWQVAALAPFLDHSSEAATVWYRLLLHLCAVAGEYQVQRLHARLLVDTPAEDVFRQVGFTAYCQEAIFLRSDATVYGRESTGVCSMSSQDRWEVKQLWATITPGLVLHAEGGNGCKGGDASSDQAVSGSGDGYVLRSANGRIRGFLHILVKPRGTWLRLLVNPGAKDSARELLDHGLSVLARQPPRPAYCAVRDYEGGLRSLLQERGFEHSEDHSLLVRHTTVRVREPRRKLVPALDKRAEVAPTVTGSTRREV